MYLPRRSADLLLLLSLVLTLWSVAHISIGLRSAFDTAGTPPSVDTTLSAFLTADSALAPKEAPAFHTFSGASTDPFGKATPAPISSPPSPARPREAVDLTLKGILATDPPLAIILDEKQRTHICKPGDMISGYVVKRILAEYTEVSKAGRVYLLRMPSPGR